LIHSQCNKIEITAKKTMTVPALCGYGRWTVSNSKEVKLEAL